MAEQHRLDEIDAELGAVVQVSTLEENDSDDSGWVTLRLIHDGCTLDVLLGPEQAKDLAVTLERHAARA